MVDRGAGAARGHLADDRRPGGAGRKGEQADLFAELRAQGFVRCASTAWCMIDNCRCSTRTAATSSRWWSTASRCARTCAPHRRILRDRAAHAEGRAIAVEMDSGASTSSPPSSPARSAASRWQELEPRLFSFNNPMGACPKPATASGTSSSSTPSGSSPTPMPVARLRRHPRLGPPQPVLLPALASLAGHYAFDIETPFEALPEKYPRTIVLTARATRRSPSAISDGGQVLDRTHLRGHHPQPRTALPRDRLGGGARGVLKYHQPTGACPACGAPACGTEGAPRLIGAATCRGQRLRWPPRGFFDGLQLTGPARQVAEKMVSEISALLGFLDQRGPRLPLARPLGRHPVGRRGQRIRLASQIGSA